ncbi:MAG: serine/threonine-protein kinase [Bacteroidota bacterium]
MDSAHWPHVQQLFEEALAHADPRAFVEAAAGDDQALAREVLSLLAADADAPAYLDAMPAWQVPQIPPHLEQLGPYRLVKAIGRGGMGAVFLAHRGDLDTHVALKLLRYPFPSDVLRQRFVQEQRFLAKLQHPHIARLMDAGATDAQLPYFVMEYVDGQPVTAYVQHHRCALDERLRLFLHVCDAVQYAHQHLIIHRDLKPSNILVDAEGQPKLLDFGIAKLVEPDDTHDDRHLQLTRTGQQVLTPAYAAPEQLLGQPHSTATDVYALGLILYELLTDVRAYALEGCSPRQVETLICERDPVRPSMRVQTLSPSRESARRARRLHGDLDAIALKALRKAPADRYTSVEAFAADLRQHLAGAPVTARVPTAGYLARKFIQRHRWAVASVLVVVAALVVVGLRERTLRHTAEAAQVAAEEARRESESVADFLGTLFRGASPYSEAGLVTPETTALELLQFGTERLASELNTEPAMRATLQTRIGDVYADLALFEQADSLLLEALALRQDAHGPDAPEVAESYLRLSALREDQDRPREATTLALRALAIQRQHTTVPTVLAETLDRVGTTYWMRTMPDSAAYYLRQAHQLHRDEPPSVSLAKVQNNLALAVQDLGDVQEAEALLRASLALRIDLLGADHLLVSYTQHNLVSLLELRGEMDEAETLSRQALATTIAFLGRNHPDVTDSIDQLAGLLIQNGEVAEAESLLHVGIDISRTVFGEPHSNLSNTHGWLGYLYHLQERHTESIYHYREALRIDSVVYAAEAPHRLNLLYSLGLALHSQQGGRPEARRLLHAFTDVETAADAMPEAYATAVRLLNAE